MAYLRWLDSNWYVYWIAGSEDGRSNQRLQTWLGGECLDKDSPSEMSYDEVVEFLSSPVWDRWKTDLSDIDKNEFLWALESFKEEVENSFPNDD